MTDIEAHERIDVYVSVDVGKGAHHAVALDLTGKRLLDNALPNGEAKLPTVINQAERTWPSTARRRSAGDDRRSSRAVA